APCGYLLRDRDVASVIDWSSIAGHRCLAENGLSEAAAIKVRVAPFGGDFEHVYVALFQEAGASPLDAAAAATVVACWREIGEALERLRVPVLAGEHRHPEP